MVEGVFALKTRRKRAEILASKIMGIADEILIVDNKLLETRSYDVVPDYRGIDPNVIDTSELSLGKAIVNGVFDYIHRRNPRCFGDRN